MTRKEIYQECAGVFNNEFDEHNAVNLSAWAANHQIDQIIDAIRRNHPWVGKIDLLDELIKEIEEHKIK